MALFVAFLNTLAAYVPGHWLRLYPMWKTRGWKTRSIIIFYVCSTAFQFGGVLLLRQWTSRNPGLYNLSLAVLGIPQMTVPFFIFRKRFLQHLFLLALSCSYGAITVGIGHFVKMNWAGDAHRRAQCRQDENNALRGERNVRRAGGLFPGGEAAQLGPQSGRPVHPVFGMFILAAVAISVDRSARGLVIK